MVCGVDQLLDSLGLTWLIEMWGMGETGNIYEKSCQLPACVINTGHTQSASKHCATY